MRVNTALRRATKPHQPRSPVMRHAAALIPVLFLMGCKDLPRDTAGTTQRIEASGVLRAALLTGTPDAAPATNILQSYAAAHGARLRLVPVQGEHAHRALQDGKIDALIGHFAKTSPFQAEMSLSQPVGRSEPDDNRHPVLRIARRNGENRLILATDRLIAKAVQ